MYYKENLKLCQKLILLLSILNLPTLGGCNRTYIYEDMPQNSMKAQTSVESFRLLGVTTFYGKNKDFFTKMINPKTT